jgi:putative membrane protein
MKPVKTLLAKIPLIALTFMALITADPVLAQSGRYENWHMGRGMMGGWGMGWFGGIFMIIFWILILVALVYFIRWLIQSTGRGHSNAAGGNRALEILQERYARGEIDKTKFETMKRDLSN